MRCGGATDRMGEDLVEAFHGEFTPKFLATRGGDGRPNVVPIISLDAVDDRTVTYGELFMWKTRGNLESDGRVAIVVATDSLATWSLRGRLREVVTDGAYVDAINAKPLFRYNAYVRVSRVGVIDVERVVAARHYSRLSVAGQLLPIWAMRRWLDGGRGGRVVEAGEDEVRMPERLAEKFARTQAVKVMAWLDEEGWPVAVPAFSLTPGRSDRLFVKLGGGGVGGPRIGQAVAASVITMDPIAYQVKGTFVGQRLTPLGRIGQIEVREAYSASPPLAGERIELSPQGAATG